MHMLHSRNPWSYSQGFNMMVDFCLPTTAQLPYSTGIGHSDGN